MNFIAGIFFIYFAVNCLIHTNLCVELVSIDVENVTETKIDGEDHQMGLLDTVEGIRLRTENYLAEGASPMRLAKSLFDLFFALMLPGTIRYTLEYYAGNPTNAVNLYLRIVRAFQRMAANRSLQVLFPLFIASYFI